MTIELTQLQEELIIGLGILLSPTPLLYTAYVLFKDYDKSINDYRASQGLEPIPERPWWKFCFTCA
ncbi:MAG: hypothetical protein HRT47_11065 [Candidatus Caenarcaniphilales bacterium]|nr:hypothetical protein [Candidatus Caenarcaniphilales bacterium]